MNDGFPRGPYSHHNADCDSHEGPAMPPCRIPLLFVRDIEIAERNSGNEIEKKVAD